MADSAFLKAVRQEHASAAMGHRYGLAFFLNSRDDVIFHFGDVGRFQGLLGIAPDHGTAAVAVGNDDHGAVVSRKVVFGEITSKTGLQRPRQAPKRVALAAVRLTAARVLA
jgi:hypothetical protein